MGLREAEVGLSAWNRLLQEYPIFKILLFRNSTLSVRYRYSIYIGNQVGKIRAESVRLLKFDIFAGETTAFQMDVPQTDSLRTIQQHHATFSESRGVSFN